MALAFSIAGDFDAVADFLAKAPYRRAFRTSISGALKFALPLFGQNGQRVALLAGVGHIGIEHSPTFS